MKFTDANVYLIEHLLIQDSNPLEVHTPEQARDALMYIAGINAMAQAVIEGMREVKNA